MATAVTTAPTQGKDIYLSVSTDNGTTYKKIVCLIKQSLEKQRNVNKTNTQCGVIPGIGEAERTLPFEGVANVIAVGEATDYLSYAELDTIFEAGNTVMVKQLNGATEVMAPRKAVLSDLKKDMPTDNVVTFSGTFNLF